MAGVHIFTESVLVPKIMGLAALVLTAFFMKRLGCAAAGLLILMDPLLHFAAFSGMEVNLFILLSLLALERDFAGKPQAAGVAAAGALLSRPEGAFLWMLLLLLNIKTGAKGAERLKNWAKLAVPSFLVMAAWMTFCYCVTGRPFPNTFYVKLGSFPGFDMQNPFTLLFSFLAEEGPLFLPIICLLTLAAFLIRPDRRAVGALLYFVALFFGVCATRLILLVEAFYWQRYLIPALLGVYLLMGLGLHTLGSLGQKSKVFAWFLGVLLVGMLCLQWEQRRDLYEKNCRDIKRFNVEPGRWILENTEGYEKIAVLDAGAIRYFGKRDTIDLVGLNTKTLTKPITLPIEIDPSDPALLAAFTKADWLVLPKRHYSGRGEFILFHEVSYDDYTLYIKPERFTLLFLKKEHAIN
jgi:hypothetical protein